MTLDEVPAESVDTFVTLLEDDVAALRARLGASVRLLGKLQVRQLLDREYKLELARRARMSSEDKARAAKELTDELGRLADAAEARRDVPARPARGRGA